MKTRALVSCGMLASIVNIVAVVVGGLMRPCYNHVSNFISDLIGSGAQNKWLLDPIFGLYNLLCLACGLGAFLRV